MKVSFEVRCENCGFIQLWGLERMLQALIRCGKFSRSADFDANLIPELFRVHCCSVECPECKTTGKIFGSVPKKNTWEWADEVRCEECNREIPPERLAAIPGVKRCFSCQKEFENEK